MTGAPHIRSTGPGPGAGTDHDPEHSSMLSARIGIVATIVLGQLWGLQVALNEWFQNRTAHVVWLLGFEAASFVVAFLVWLAVPRRERP